MWSVCLCNTNESLKRAQPTGEEGEKVMMNVVVTPPRNNNNNNTSVSPVPPGAPTRNVGIAFYKPNTSATSSSSSSSAHRKLEDALKDINVENPEDDV